MQDIVFKDKVIEFLHGKSLEYKTRPIKFTPSQITNAVGGGHPPRIGVIADDVVRELNARGIKIEYKRPGNKRFFQLS
jgi:hypothetical protein